MKQLIQISDGGAMTALRVAPGRGIDLREFGKASITRTTEILWDEDYQRWLVMFIKTKQPLAHRELFEATGIVAEAVIGLARKADFEPLALFREYEDAVAAEIAYIQSLRTANGPDAV